MSLRGDALKDAIGQTQAKWGWFVGLGVLLLILGGIAFGNLFVATVASVYVVGWLMLMAGVIEILPLESRHGAASSTGCSAGFSMPSPGSSPSTIRCWPRRC